MTNAKAPPARAHGGQQALNTADNSPESAAPMRARTEDENTISAP